MRFNPGSFDTHLTGIGQQVQWRRSYSCACVSPTSGNADPKHALCRGKGRLWDAPIDTVTGIASQQVQAQWINAGMYENGDMVMSVPQASPLWDAGQFDRVLLLNSTTSFSMPLHRGAPTERLLFTVKSLVRCFWLHPQDRNVVVVGALPLVDANGNLSWPGGVGEPPFGISYSLTGEKSDEYFIFQNFSSDRNQHSGMRLPKRIVARKWDLFGR